jgi:hypothetical protein
MQCIEMKINAPHSDYNWRLFFGLGLIWIFLGGVLLLLALWWQ